MRANVILKSMLRQPLRCLLLILLIGAASFAFVARSVEYIVVRDQINEIAGFFQPVGVLRPADGNFASDVSMVADFLADSTFVATDDRRRGFEGVLQDIQNPIIIGEFFWAFWAHTWLGALPDFDAAWIYEKDYELFNEIEPYMNHLATDYPGFAGFMSGDAFLYGELVDMTYVHEIPEDWMMGGAEFFAPFLDLLVLVDRHYAGYDDHMATGAYIILRYYLDEGSLPIDELEIGGRYFFKATHYYLMGSFSIMPYDPNEGILNPMRRNVLFLKPLSDGFWFMPIEQGNYIDFDTDGLESIRQSIYLANHAQRSVHVRTTTDMTLMGDVANGNIAIVDGRLLNKDDYLEQRPVVAVHQLFAQRRGLSVGDTITVSVNTEQHLAEPNYYWPRWSMGSVVGTFADIGVLSVPGASIVHELELEIVGIYSVYAHRFGGIEYSTVPKFIYIPDSLLPQDLRLLSAPWGELHAQYTPVLWYSFALSDSRHTSAFMSAYGDILADMGFLPEILGRDSTNFWITADLTLQAATVNMVLFSTALLLVLSFVTFLFYRQSRKDIAILLALGCPPKSIVGQCLTAVVVFWLPAIIIGGLAGWQFALGAAETTLLPFGEIIADSLGAEMPWVRDEIVSGFLYAALPSTGVLAMLISTIPIVMVATVLGAAQILIHRPVLEQLQGNTARKKEKKKKKPKPVEVSEYIPAESHIKIAHVVSDEHDNKKSPKGIAELAHIMRHILRSPIKTALILAVSAALVVATGLVDEAIRQSEAEINRLYDTTIAYAEVFWHPNDPTRPRHRLIFDLIPRRHLEQISALDVVYDAHIEAGHAFSVILPANDGRFPYDRLLDSILTEDDEIQMAGAIAGQLHDTFDYLFAADDLRRFPNLEVSFAEGFGEEDFAYAPNEPIPIIISEQIGQNRGVAAGDIVFIAFADYNSYLYYVLDISNYQHGFSTEPAGDMPGWRYVTAVIVGTHNGMDLIEIFADAALMPLAAIESLLGQNLGYITFRFGINPAHNRDLSSVAQGVSDIIRFLPFGWSNHLTVSVFDDEIRQVIEPMEQNLLLFRLLHPIVIALSVIIGLGFSLLLLLQNAKNAALMIVLGNTKVKTRIILLSELMLLCFLGALIGMIVLAIATNGIDASSAFSSLPYIAGATAGAIVGVILITNRPPLDLLQVKE